VHQSVDTPCDEGEDDEEDDDDDCDGDVFLDHGCGFCGFGLSGGVEVVWEPIRLAGAGGGGWVRAMKR
jgi:hypothetical protein